MTNPTLTDDDLVKRLKETIEFGLFDTPNPVTFDECLAEIEYLRADLASACSQLSDADREPEIAALRAENARLRDALKFYGHRPHYAARNGMDSAISRDNFGDQARAALGAENEG